MSFSKNFSIVLVCLTLGFVTCKCKFNTQQSIECHYPFIMTNFDNDFDS